MRARNAKAAALARSPVDHYAWLRELLIKERGDPTWRLTLPGPPRGFTVSRGYNKSSAPSFAWATELQRLLDHHYQVDYLVASEDHPIFFYTEAWFCDGRHPDPENVGKLARDALFYHSPPGSGKDKYTGGAHAGPLYDKLHPRTEIYAWRLTAPRIESQAERPKPIVRRAKQRPKRLKIKNPFESMK